MPLRSKSLAFLIENSWNQNSFQLADNKRKRPVLIENFEPNRARVFASRRAPQSDPAVESVPPIIAFLTETGAQAEIDVTRSKQTAPSFLTETRIACLISPSAFLPGSASQVECDVTHSKQTAGEFLAGARTASWRTPNRLREAPRNYHSSPAQDRSHHRHLTRREFPESSLRPRNRCGLWGSQCI